MTVLLTHRSVTYGRSSEIMLSEAVMSRTGQKHMNCMTLTVSQGPEIH